MTLPARPRLRSGVSAVHRDALLVVSDLAAAVVHEYEVGSAVADLVRELDGSAPLDELADRHGDLALEVIEVLHEDGLVVDGPMAPTTGPWSNQLRFLDTLGDPGELQDRLRGATVAVVGVGGVGSWVVQALASAGVGRLRVIDRDVVEDSNLNRQVVFEPGDVGMPKVQALQQRFRSRFPRTVVEPVQERVDDAESLSPLLADASLVVCCADEPDVLTISSVVAAAARTRSVPAIVGGAYGAAIGAPGLTVLPGGSPCWDCARTTSEGTTGIEGPVRDVTPAGPSAGSFAPLVGMVGTMVAWEACRVILGLVPAFAGRLREFDVATLEWRGLPVVSRPACACRAS